jgi:hypothetical protein
VTPPSAANAEGDSFVTPDTTPIRIQYLIPAAEFAGLPATNRYLIAFNFRSDGAVTQAVNWTMPHERVWVSTTSKTSLTTVFDDNHGTNRTMVFDGTMTFPLVATGPASGPKNFANGTPFQTPFLYDPSQGNLLVEIQDFDKNFPIPATVDVTTIAGSARTLLNAGNPNATAGNLIPGVVSVMQLEFVPEPSTFVLLGVALTGLGLVAWRRKSGDLVTP